MKRESLTRKTTERHSRHPYLKGGTASFSSLLCLIAVFLSFPATLRLPRGNVAGTHHQHAAPIQLERG